MKSSSAFVVIGFIIQLCVVFADDEDLVFYHTPGQGSGLTKRYICGLGKTCASACGAGFEQCGTVSTHCYDKAAGEVCCGGSAGYACLSGEYCAPVDGYCCLNGTPIGECGFNGGFTTPIPKPTSKTVKPTTRTVIQTTAEIFTSQPPVPTVPIIPTTTTTSISSTTPTTSDRPTSSTPTISDRPTISSLPTISDLPTEIFSNLPTVTVTSVSTTSSVPKVAAAVAVRVDAEVAFIMGVVGLLMVL